MVRSWRPQQPRLQRKERRPKSSDRNRPFAQFLPTAQWTNRRRCWVIKLTKAFVPASTFCQDDMDFQQITLFLPYIPPVTAARHARFALLAVITPACSLLTNHMLMPSVQMKQGDRFPGKGQAVEGNRKAHDGAEEKRTYVLTFDLYFLLRCQVPSLHDTIVNFKWTRRVQSHSHQFIKLKEKYQSQNTNMSFILHILYSYVSVRTFWLTNALT